MSGPDPQHSRRGETGDAELPAGLVGAQKAGASAAKTPPGPLSLRILDPADQISLRAIW